VVAADNPIVQPVLDSNLAIQVMPAVQDMEIQEASAATPTISGVVAVVALLRPDKAFHFLLLDELAVLEEK
jgi:predicted hydrolase (HD superfamily)